MRKTGAIIILSALVLSAQTCAKKDAAKYNDSLGRWRAESIDSYYIKVRYGAFSAQQGEWELYVEKGIIVEARYNGVSDGRYIKQADRFTVDAIYQTAADSAACDEKSPMCTTVEFSHGVPYIKSVKRINNSSFTGEMKKDAGFSIVVVEFRRG